MPRTSLLVFAFSLFVAQANHANMQTNTRITTQETSQDDEQIDDQLIDDQQPVSEKSGDNFSQILEELAQQLESHDPIDILMQFNAKREAFTANYQENEVNYLASIINLAIDNELLAMQRNAFQYAAENNLKKARLITAALETVSKKLEPVDSVRAAYAKSVNKNIEAAIALNE